MDQDISPAPAEGFAYRAFEDLRAEVSLLRRGVEALTAERQSAPDYAPSLAKIDEDLRSLIEWAQKVNERPGVKLGPQSFAAELARAGEAVRRGDAETLAQAQAQFEEAARRIERMIVSGRTAAQQSRVLLHNRLYSLVAGMLIWATIPGMIARSLPVSWAVPERIAARMLGLDLQSEGERLIAAAEPRRRQELRHQHPRPACTANKRCRKTD